MAFKTTSRTAGRKAVSLRRAVSTTIAQGASALVIAIVNVKRSTGREESTENTAAKFTT